MHSDLRNEFPFRYVNKGLWKTQNSTGLIDKLLLIWEKLSHPYFKDIGITTLVPSAFINPLRFFYGSEHFVFR